MTPQWLKDAVVEGLQALLVLRLNGIPAKDTLPATANVWIAAISSRPILWEEDRDKPRIRKAFMELAATAERWPSPAELLRAMPPRTPQLKLTPPVERHYSQKSREMVDALLVTLKSKRAGTSGG